MRRQLILAVMILLLLVSPAYARRDYEFGIGSDIDNLVDPDADRIMFWDDSEGLLTWLTASTGLTLTTTNLTVGLGTAITSDEITDGEVSTADLKDDSIEIVDVNMLNTPADEDILVYDTATGGGFKGQTLAELFNVVSSLDLPDGFRFGDSGEPNIVFDEANDDLELYGGDRTFVQNKTDSTTGFQILDADGGTPILDVDTTNERVGIGMTGAGMELDVNGDIRANISYGSVYIGSGASNGVGIRLRDYSGNGTVLQFYINGTQGVAMTSSYAFDAVLAALPIRIANNVAFLSRNTASDANLNLIYADTSDNVRVGNSGEMTINGNVGIGRTDPNNRLMVGSADASDYIEVYHDNTNAVFLTDDGDFTFTVTGGGDGNMQFPADVAVEGDIYDKTSTDVMYMLKTVVKTINLDASDDNDDFEFDDTAGNSTSQNVNMGAIIPAYAEVVSVQARCFETVGGSQTFQVTLGTGSAGAQLLAQTTVDATNEIDGTAAGAGPKLEAANAAKNVWINGDPSANWSDCAGAGRWAVFVTYIDYGAAYTQKSP